MSDVAGAKPMGPIPPEYARLDQLPWRSIDGPTYVYDAEVMLGRWAELRGALPTALDIHYAVKANPHPGVLGVVAPSVAGLDVASEAEMALALAYKPAERISFAGPGKRDAELAAAISAGVTINLESEGEATRALVIAERLGIRPLLAVRVNPDLELRGSGMRMGGRASPFGVDADRVPALIRHVIDAGADWRGLHIFAGSQSLDTAAIIETQSETLRLAARISNDVDADPPRINIGGGFGIPYFAGDTPIDVHAIGDALAPRLAEFAGSAVAIELGRYLVGEAGTYLARVVDRKQSRGETFLIVEGGLNHNLAATGNLGTVVRRNYPVAVAHRLRDPAEEVVTIVGPLCTPLDRLAERVALPRAQVGDVIAVFASGAYGASASPTRFLGHPEPREIVVGLAEG